MSKNRTWLVLAALGVLLVAGVVAGIMVLPDEKIVEAAEQAKPKISIADLPAVAEQTPQQTAQTLASEEFGKLSAEKKEVYYQELIDAGEAAGEEAGRGRMREFFQAAQDMSDEQRERLMANGRELGMAFMERRMDDYFALSEEEKNAHLDERIDQIQQWRERSESNEGGNEGGGRGRRGGGHRQFTPEHLKRIIETVSPARRAKFVQYHQDLQDRMEQRGIETNR